MTVAKKLVVIGVPLVALLIVVGFALGFIFFYKRRHAVFALLRQNPCIMEAKIVSTICLLILFGCSESIASESRLKLVIDHDGGADDAFAITLCLLYEKYFGGPNVVALTTTHGNVNLSQVIINSDRILTLSNRNDVPIYAGANQALVSGIVSDYYYGYDGLGDDGYLPPGPIKVEKEPSAIALVELSKKYEGELIVIAVGPLSNVALAARLDPEFIGRLAHLYVGGGHIYNAEHTSPEFNADMDPEAYFIVADSAIANKVTFVPFSQIYSSFNISADWRYNVLGLIPTPIIKALNGFERISSVGDTLWIQLDPAVAALALNNNIVEEFKYTNNSIELCGHQRSINTNDFQSSEPNVRLVYAANQDRYKKFLIDVYSAELSN